jgi:hypothetical protein
MGRITDWRINRRKKKLASISNDGWLWVQRGNQYELEQLHRDSDADAYYVERDDGTKEFYEDNIGMMHTWQGVPFGIATDRSRVIADAETAQIAATVDQKEESNELVNEDSVFRLGDIMEHLTVGQIAAQGGQKAIIVNPFHRKDDEPDIVDVRPVTKLMRRAARPDTPRKAAKNAIEAERATKGLGIGGAMDYIALISAFLVGAITVEYIAGGGGGGIDVGGIGLMILFGL